MWFNIDHNPFHPSWTTMHDFTMFLSVQTYFKVEKQTSRTHKAVFLAFVTICNAWSNINPISLLLFVSFMFFQLCIWDWNWCGKVNSDVNGSPFSLALSLSLALFQLCVQKLRILIEDSDQNCEPSVNACSVSFSHCLRVSDYGTVRPLRRQQPRPPDSG